jgi:hypothetical protein
MLVDTLNNTLSPNVPRERTPLDPPTLPPSVTRTDSVRVGDRDRQRRCRARRPPFLPLEQTYSYTNRGIAQYSLVMDTKGSNITV